jgi:hypothetical protein
MPSDSFEGTPPPSRVRARARKSASVSRCVQRDCYSGLRKHLCELVARYGKRTEPSGRNSHYIALAAPTSAYAPGALASAQCKEQTRPLTPEAALTRSPQHDAASHATVACL